MIDIIKDNNTDSVDVEKIVYRVVKYDKNIDDMLKRFNISDKSKFCFPIILRTGGIGDLIALSSISCTIPKLLKKGNNIMRFVSQEKYRDVFPWFKTNIKFISYFAPIAQYPSNSSIDRRRINNKFKPIFFEGVIENSNKNWFNIQYEEIGVTSFKESYGRPMLRTKRVSNKPSNIDTNKRSILVNPRSTAVIRSMRFQDIYEAIVAIIKDEDINIYVHERNIRQPDKDFIEKINDDRVLIINAKSLGDFFLDAFDVDLTISVDTALLHFREGVERAGVGLYGPFPYECRSLYYKHTLSFNIESKCPTMPCYIHVKKWDAICDFQQGLHDNGIYDESLKEFAPCCCKEWNNGLIDQLVDKMSTYVKEKLSITK